MNAPSTDNALPTDMEAEEALVGAMLASEFAREAATDAGLSDAAFYRPALRVLYSTLVRMGAERQPIDERTVIIELKKRGELAAAGGGVYVMGLSERAPAVANSRAYAAGVLRAATLRSLVEAGHGVAKLGYDGVGEPEQLVAAAGELVAGVVSGTPESASEYGDNHATLEAMFDEWGELVRQGRTPGLATGLPALDAMVSLLPGKLVVVAGRPGMGKSALAMQIGGYVAASGGRVGVYSLEMTRREVLARMVSAASGVDGRKLTQTMPADGDFDALMPAMQQLAESTRTLFVRDAPGLTPSRLRTLARRLKRRSGLDLVVVDYLTIMEADRRGGNRTEEVTQISRSLKALALELDVPVLACAQLNRSVEARPDRRPMLSDLRESGSIEQDADVVAFVLRPEYYWPDDVALCGRASVIVAKNRGGPKGEVALGFDAATTRFLPEPPRRVYHAGIGAVS
jgi:replicative DNA helicase